MIKKIVQKVTVYLTSRNPVTKKKVMASAAVTDLKSQNADGDRLADLPATSCDTKSPNHPESSDNQLKDKVEGSSSLKRPHEDIAEDSKKLKTDPPGDEGSTEGRPFRKKKVAMLMVYSGKGYMGMQRNPGFHTIEEDLLTALVKAGVVTPDHITQPGIKMGFQRASRTDKGVSAAGQVCSLKMFIDVENPIEKINSHLPEQIRVLGIKRTTKGFNSKNACMARTYIYLLPTVAFAPIEEIVTEGYRVSEDILKRVNEILALYKGTHNFHNFTSGKKPNDVSAKRYIIFMEVGKPFIRDDIEYAVITVKGQSFMLHQIRKLIGLMTAIVRGLANVDIIDRAWQAEKVDIPKAPGLGLILDKLHYDPYNKKYGCDGVHEPIDWDVYKDEIDKFKEKYIFKTIYDTEKTEKSMLNWLATLPLHSYEYAEYDNEGRTKSPQNMAAKLIKSTRLEQENDSDETGNTSD